MAQQRSKKVDPSKLPKGVQLKFKDPAALETPEGQAWLRNYLQMLEANPLIGYYPHGKQLEFHRRIRKIRVFLGGNRSGKSVAGVCDDLIQAVDRDVLPPHLVKFKIWEPPFRCRIVVPDFGRPFGAVLETIRQWVPPSQLLGGSWEEAYRDKDHVLTFKNGSFLEFMTQEQDISKFGGTSRERIHYDEEPRGEKGIEIREENAQRLIETRGDELFTFTPFNLGWLFDDLWESKGEETEPEVWVSDQLALVQVDQTENPHLDEKGREEAEMKTRESMREARKSGKFVHKHGMVYPSFGTGHLVNLDPTNEADREFVQGLTQYDGIDPGVVTTAVLFAGFDSDNVLWIFDELYLTGKQAIPENAAALIRAKRAEWGLPTRPKATLIDPAAASRNVQTGEATDRAYYRAGIKTFPAKNKVEAGIFEVLRRMENTSKDGEHLPLIYINERCEKLRWEIVRYRQDLGPNGEFGVVKKNDHACDVMRYLSMARPLVPEGRKRNKAAEMHWVPGTAPAYVPPKPTSGGPLGMFT